MGDYQGYCELFLNYLNLMLQLESLNHKDTSQLIMKTILNVVSTNLSHVMTHVHLRIKCSFRAVCANTFCCCLPRTLVVELRVVPLARVNGWREEQATSCLCLRKQK